MSAVVLRAAKLSVARANCGPSRRRAGRASSAAQEQTYDGMAAASAGNHAEAEPGDDEAGGVGAQPEEGGMAEVHLAEVTHGDVQADEEDAVDGQQGEQAQRVGIHYHQRDGGEEGEDREFGATEEENALHAQTFRMTALPKTPVGRTARARISRMRPGASRQPLPR